jgi:23S rRNA (guanosine2251-2'-O)-methyltransferase
MTKYRDSKGSKDSGDYKGPSGNRSKAPNYRKRDENGFDQRDGGERFEREKLDEDSYIFGVRSVIEAVKTKQEINKIMIQKGMDKELFYELKDALADNKYHLQFVPQAKLNSITRKNHQGVIAILSPIKYQDIKDILPMIYEKGEIPNILVLDRITDVRNFGAIARTASCMGVHAIVVPQKGSAAITADAVKTSAGALNSIPICREDNISHTLQFLKESGIQLIACTEKSDKELFEADLIDPTAIIMGSEEDGISNDLLKMADQRLKIPMGGTIQSLNVGVAAGMILLEKFRQSM